MPLLFFYMNALFNALSSSDLLGSISEWYFLITSQHRCSFLSLLLLFAIKKNGESVWFSLPYHSSFSILTSPFHNLHQKLIKREKKNVSAEPRGALNQDPLAPSALYIYLPISL